MADGFKPKNQQVELIFALAGPVGTDFDFVAATLADSLKAVSYTSEVIKLSRFLREYHLSEGLLPIDLTSTFEDERIREHQRAGNALRKALDDHAALAIRAIRAIAENHLATQDGETSGYKAPRRHAFILDSLKRPEEVHQLRQVYGPGFFLIGVVSPRTARIQRLASNIAKSRGSADVREWVAAATTLVDIDEKEESKFGQNLSDTFPLADLFVAFGPDAEQSQANVKTEVRRFVRLIMGANDTTPTAEEAAMFHAFGAAVRSGSLARQVGAALANSRGDILSVGCNDVPRAGGGIYWETDHYDHRDIRKKRDSSQEHEEQIVCAKLIIGAGVSRVVYIEPYPKSRVAGMYKTEIAMESFKALCNSCEAGSTTSNECSSCGSKDLLQLETCACVECGSLHRVEFQPFVGIGPRKYLELFVMTSTEGLKFKRKDKAGYRLPWTPAQRSPMFPLSYLEKESSLYDEFTQAFEKLKKKEEP